MTALLGLATRLRLARLALITDCRAETGDLAAFTQAALSGGVDLVQLRDPRANHAEQLAALRTIREVGFHYQGLVSAYESGSLAHDFGADLLHLSERGMPAATARTYLHEWALIGRSCHSPAQIEAAAADREVDYLTVGPVFGAFGDGSTGLALVRRAAEVLPCGDVHSKPWFAAGGITGANLDAVLDAGARRVAVSRAITAAEDVEAAALGLKQRLRQAWNDDPAMADLVLKAFGK